MSSPRSSAFADRPGIVAWLLKTYPHGDSTAIQPEDDPVWAAIQETGKPATIHVSLRATSSFNLTATALPGTMHFYDTPARMLDFIFSGVLDRFADLTVFLAEVDCGWLPYFAQQADDNYMRHSKSELRDVKMSGLPSDYMKQRFPASFITDTYAIDNRHAVGIERDAVVERLSAHHVGLAVFVEDDQRGVRRRSRRRTPRDPRRERAADLRVRPLTRVVRRASCCQRSAEATPKAKTSNGTNEGWTMQRRGAPSTFVISQTAFTADGEIDWSAQRAHLQRLATSGIGVYVGGGGSGEGHTLLPDEVDELLALAAEELVGKVPARAMGVEPRTARQMIEFGKQVEASGLEAMQIYSLDMGHLGQPQPAELDLYFREVVENVVVADDASPPTSRSVTWCRSSCSAPCATSTTRSSGSTARSARTSRTSSGSSTS